MTDWDKQVEEEFRKVRGEYNAQLELLRVENDALRQQCEAMASSLEYARNCVENFNIINLEAKAAESKLNEALTAYKKFKEGG